MSGPTHPWDQDGDPRDNTVDLPRIDPDLDRDYFGERKSRERASLFEPAPPVPSPDQANGRQGIAASADRQAYALRRPSDRAPEHRPSDSPLFDQIMARESAPTVATAQAPPTMMLPADARFGPEKSLANGRRGAESPTANAVPSMVRPEPAANAVPPSSYGAEGCPSGSLASRDLRSASEPVGGRLRAGPFGSCQLSRGSCPATGDSACGAASGFGSRATWEAVLTGDSSAG